MIKQQTIITILAIISVLVVGIVVLFSIEDVFPQAVPEYDNTFSVGSSPYTYNVGRDDLSNLVVRQRLSNNTWVAISPTDYTYSGNTVTISADALFV